MLREYVKTHFFQKLYVFFGLLGRKHANIAEVKKLQIEKLCSRPTTQDATRSSTEQRDTANINDSPRLQLDPNDARDAMDHEN